MMSSTCVITVNNRSCCWCTVGRQIHVHSSLRSDDSEWVTDRASLRLKLQGVSCCCCYCSMPHSAVYGLVKAVGSVVQNFYCHSYVSARPCSTTSKLYPYINRTG